ncbi:MAG UNVERIFIED_CONTAM: peptidoglycan-binding protein, partial [Rickettsiaceae bacterium]
FYANILVQLRIALFWDLLLKNGLGIDILPSQLDAIAKSIEHTAKQSTYNYGSLRFTCDENKETIQKIQQELKNIGYKIEITGNFDEQTNFVLRAFQSHFYQDIIWKKGGMRILYKPEFNIFLSYIFRISLDTWH